MQRDVPYKSSLSAAVNRKKDKPDKTYYFYKNLVIVGNRQSQDLCSRVGRSAMIDNKLYGNPFQRSASVMLIKSSFYYDIIGKSPA